MIIGEIVNCKFRTNKKLSEKYIKTQKYHIERSGKTISAKNQHLLFLRSIRNNGKKVHFTLYLYN